MIAPLTIFHSRFSLTVMFALRFPFFLLVWVSLSAAFLPRLVASESEIRIPFIQEASVDEWPAKAFQVEVLTPRPPTQSPNPSRLALAWSAEGLQVWVDVDDSTPDEAATPSTLWMADSIELFVASPAGSKDFIQLIGAPGRVKEFNEPRWFYANQQKEKRTFADPVIRVNPRKAGYRMMITFPWSNLLNPPKEGDRVGVQLYVNNTASGSAKSRLVWAPSEDNNDPKTYRTVQLAREASAPEKLAAWMVVEKLSDPVVKVVGTPDQAGKPVFAKTGAASKWTKLGQLAPAASGLSRTSLSLPAGMNAQAKEKLEVKVDGELLAPLEIPDIAAMRLKVLKDTDIVSKPSVFGGRVFPPIDFLNKELADAVFGPCEIKVRWFNDAYEKVVEATESGRYGALVEIRTADGLIDQRRLALYHTPKSFTNRVDRFESSIRFPEAFGFAADIAPREAGATGDFMNSLLHSQARQDAGWAVLLAGLSDLAAHPEELHGLDVWAINEDWWYGLDKKLGTAKPYEFLTYLPKGYEANDGKTWPLVLFLHGSGERGTDLNKVKKNGLTKLLEAGKEFPFITVAPQCPEGQWWGAARLDDLLNQVAAQYRVDPKRIYVTGISMGGFGAWNLAGRYPEKFAAAVPVCGGALPELGERLKAMPIWAFHGEDDVSVPVQASQRIVEAIQKAGGTPKLTIYPGVGHSSWVQAYDEAELYDWLLKQSR